MSGRTLAEECGEFRALCIALWNEIAVKPLTPVVAKLNEWLERGKR